MSKKQKEKKAQGLRVETLTELRVGADQFTARGFCDLKIMRGEEEVALRIPIRSISMDDVDALGIEIPLPPREERVIRPNDPDARAFGLAGKGGFVEVVKNQDPEYRRAFGEYLSQQGLGLIGLAIELPIRNEKGEDVTEPFKKIAALRKMGFSRHHFDTLILAIEGLTKKAEEHEENF